jgi:hypothetical protein
MNPAKITGQQLYNEHINGYFGKFKFEEKELYDMVIFQNCETCALLNSENISLFNSEYTIDCLCNILKPGGIFVNAENCYFRHRGHIREDAKEDVAAYFTLYDKMNNKTFSRPMDIWRKKSTLVLNVLSVCANGDNNDNLNMSKYIVEQLGLTNDDNIYTSLNIDSDKKPTVYDNHITYNFGSDDKYEEILTKKYDIVIFQGCMSCYPDNNKFNIFDQKHTYKALCHVLNDDGMFINFDDCYYKNNNIQGAKRELEKNFVLTKTIPRKYGRKVYDVWKRKKQPSGVFITSFYFESQS